MWYFMTMNNAIDQKLTKQHYIVYAMEYLGLNGAGRVQILRKVHELQNSVTPFKVTSHRSYFCDTTKDSNGRKLSLIKRKLVRRTRRDTYELTLAGRVLAGQVQPFIVTGNKRFPYYPLELVDAIRQENRTREQVVEGRLTPMEDVLGLVSPPTLRAWVAHREQLSRIEV